MGRALQVYLSWIAVSAAGWALGVALPAALSALGTAGDGGGHVGFMATLFMIPAVGFGLGAGQGFVLDRFTRGAAAWAVATALALPLGAAVAFVLLVLPSTITGRREPDWWMVVTLGGAIGVVSGTAQAFWWRRRAVPRALALAWVTASVLGWVAAVQCARSAISPWLGLPSGDSIAIAPAVPLPLLAGAWLTTGAALGALLGAVTGLPLAAMLARVRADAE